MYNMEHTVPIVVKSTQRPNNIGIGTWAKQTTAYADDIANQAKVASKVGGKIFIVGAIVTTTGVGVYDNIQNGTDTQRIVTDAVVDATFSAGSIAAGAAAGAAIGSVIPVAGTAVGAVVGGVVVIGGSIVTSVAFETVMEKPKEKVKGWVDTAVDFYASPFK